MGKKLKRSKIISKTWYQSFFFWAKKVSKNAEYEKHYFQQDGARTHKATTVQT